MYSLFSDLYAAQSHSLVGFRFSYTFQEAHNPVLLVPKHSLTVGQRIQVFNGKKHPCLREPT